MASTPQSPIMFRNTMRVEPGHREGFRAAVERAAAFTERHAPQLMVEVYFDEDRSLAYSFQLYPDSAAVLEHWRISDPHIREVMEYSTVLGLDVYGEPDAAVREGLDSFSRESGAPVAFHPRVAGFTRSAPAPAR
ncbi:hypothetical protein FZ103_03040 [Streptomonospora sp. PA3]|uniref:Uma2 family endonuclease n=1 Tax=Streptomonospora sp. PA3 TaxID=2607326 RepID=UPI0012DD2E65|nr:Uma2 family endonuclease [Streptomonospora sp. PA3]MUL40161.1 hypothetical protein [Streptomonospora sp. PA3]